MAKDDEDVQGLIRQGPNLQSPTGSLRPKSVRRLTSARRPGGLWAILVLAVMGIGLTATLTFGERHSPAALAPSTLPAPPSSSALPSEGGLTAGAQAPDTVGAPAGPGDEMKRSLPTDPTIGTAKRGFTRAQDWCGALSRGDVEQATGLVQVGEAITTPICTVSLMGGGSVFVSELGARTGDPIEIGGNSALIVRNEPSRCEVTVALNKAGNVMDVVMQDLHGPRSTCAAAVSLAERMFNALPPTS